jgi:serine/threonine-protein kinase
MGSVWLARDLALECCCAVKLLDPEVAELEHARERFLREARVSARIRGSGVVNVFDCGEWSGAPYIVMENLDGEDLRSRIDRTGPLGPETTYEIVAQLARGLAHAHAAGIVHRDVKPANVFLVREADGDSVKLLDFGIATEAGSTRSDVLTEPGLFVGTVWYASPEQLLGESVDWRTDLWSLAVLAWECLTGARPFDSDSFGRHCGMVIDQPVPEFGAEARGLPSELDHWWKKAAAREPQERFQSAKELADALGDALELPRASVPSTCPAAGQATSHWSGRTRGKVAAMRGALVASGIAVALAAGVGIGWVAKTAPGSQHASTMRTSTASVMGF